MHIGFNKPVFTGNESKYVLEAMTSSKLSGDGIFNAKCKLWFEKTLNCDRALLTPSCTQALEMAAILVNIQPGDEVIMPSFTFVSTANAFVMRGAKIVFVDIRPDTMNIDESLIEQAINSKTKAIVVVHYAGIACEMDKILEISKQYKLFLIEDAAQAICSKYKGKSLGTFGQIASFSFHETKNITSGGEGGLIIINDSTFSHRAEIIREKGTNRTQFFRGMVDKYSWIDVGSSYLPSELQASYLWGQLECIDEITASRLETWNFYYKSFKNLVNKERIQTIEIPNYIEHNGHIFYLKCKNLEDRTKLISHMKDNDIQCAFHYIPLHSSHGGLKYSIFKGEDKFTTIESERLVRLPLWFGMTDIIRQRIVECVNDYFKNN